jgi:protease-4
MTVEQVHEVARGRVWTGADAVERGLVDELGGLDTALHIARERAELPARSDFADVRRYPRIKPADRLHPPRSSESAAAAVGWGPMTGIAGRIGLPAAGPLLMPFQLDI